MESDALGEFIVAHLMFGVMHLEPRISMVENSSLVSTISLAIRLPKGCLKVRS
ncbi:hypothetical protein [Photobacterium chitinilyticum]|uniref:hypothetical protein n=1 Tax=Photobacterium chitinilyticum TaxID=2485123 RepID=UPI0013E8A686|nr:hypothetical protein [Photobacterium chitinilyticum]